MLIMELTAGLMMECSNYTEIYVHDAGTRVASLMYYDGIYITEATGTTFGANNGTVLIDHDNNGGASSIVFRSARNRGSDYGCNQY